MAQLMNGGDSVALARIAMQSSELGALLSRVATAGPSELAALQTDVLAVAAAVADSVQQARDGSTAATAALNLADARTTSRATVASVMAGMGDFHLDFASADDERNYRKREAERAADLAAQQAKHTPAGDLNGAGDALGQMVDAQAHGAQGPEFDRRWNALIDSTERLREAAKANGMSTEEFDRHLRDDLRRIMKAKGLTSAEIEARFALNPDPMQAAKTLFRDDADLAAAQRSAERAAMIDGSADAAPLDNVREAIAAMRASGMSAPPADDASPSGHGLLARNTSAAASRTV